MGVSGELGFALQPSLPKTQTFMFHKIKRILKGFYGFSLCSVFNYSFRGFQNLGCYALINPKPYPLNPKP